MRGMFEMQKAEGQEDVPRKRRYQMLEHPPNRAHGRQTLGTLPKTRPQEAGCTGA